MSVAQSIRARPRRDRSAAGVRAFAIFCAIAILLLVVAQYAVPEWAGFHTWQYAAILALGMLGSTAYPWRLRNGGDAELGLPLVVAIAGALIVAVAGLACGLLGPDSETLARAPATVLPLPDANAAAFFPNATRDSVDRGNSVVTLRRRNGTSLELALGQTRFLGGTALRLVPHPAVYVEARDARGEHLTITQPTSPAFLSPLLQFPQSVQIAGQTLPADQFGTPAAHRVVRAFYFSAEATARAHARGFAGRPAVLFAVDDDGGRPVPGGIGFAGSGEEVALAGLRLLPTVGTYPSLEVSAVPLPFPLMLGSLCLVGGLGLAGLTVIRATRHIPAKEGKSPAIEKGTPSCPDKETRQTRK